MIPITKTTRQKLRDIGKKTETYNDIVNKLLEQYQWFQSPKCRLCIEEMKTNKIKEKLLANSLEHAGDCIVISGLDRKILYINKHCEKLLNKKLKNVVGKDAKEVFNFSKNVTKAHQTILDNGKYQMDNNLTLNNGKKIKVASTGSLVKDENDRPIGIVSILKIID